MFANRVKSIALNCRLWPTFFWEEALVPKHSLDGVPVDVHMNPIYLERYGLAREYLADIIEGCTTMDQVIPKIVRAKETLLHMDLTFEPEYIYITSHVPGLLDLKASAVMLNTLPNRGEEANVDGRGFN